MRVKHTLWMEGFSATCESAHAHCLGRSTGRTFDESCAVFARRYNRGKRDGYRMVRSEDGAWSVWGCRIFDNETDARRAFG